MEEAPHKKNASFGILLIVGVIIVGALIAFVVIGSRMNKAETTQTSDTPKTDAPAVNGLSKQAFTSDVAGYKLNTPAGWNEQKGTGTANFIFFSPKPDKDATGEFKANINIAFEETKVTPLDTYVTSTQKALPLALTNYKQLSDRKITLGDMPARIIESTFLNNNHQLRNSQLIVMRDNSVYVVTGTALESSWSKYSKLFNDSMMSLTLSKVN